MSRTLKMTAIAAIVCFGALAAAPALAETQSFHVPVYYGDLDLSSDTGVNVLVKRISSTADQVCGRPGTHDFNAAIRRALDACHANAIKQAVADVGSPKLTARLNLQRPERLASR